jgi:hypothetical protein
MIVHRGLWPQLRLGRIKANLESNCVVSVNLNRETHHVLRHKAEAYCLGAPIVHTP